MIFDPMIFPKASMGLLFKAAATPTKSSGKDVIKDIRKEATINSFNSKKRDIEVSSLTIRVPRNTRDMQERRKVRKYKIIILIGYHFRLDQKCFQFAEFLRRQCIKKLFWNYFVITSISFLGIKKLKI